MSETKVGYTKGPWHLVDTPAIREIFNGCSVVASEEIDDAIIATIAEDVPEWKGNGHLLGASPELLVMLKAAGSHISDFRIIIEQAAEMGLTLHMCALT